MNRTWLVASHSSIYLFIYFHKYKSSYQEETHSHHHFLNKLNTQVLVARFTETNGGQLDEWVMWQWDILLCQPRSVVINVLPLITLFYVGTTMATIYELPVMKDRLMDISHNESHERKKNNTWSPFTENQ